VIEEVLNGGRLEVIDNLYARACPDREALDHAVPGQLP
jgi:hypothetical protein